MRCDLRQAPINANHWYVVALSAEVSERKILSVCLWNQAIALYRNAEGTLHAVEDRCPHRHVRLSHGRIRSGLLECAYHGWQFDDAGDCVSIADSATCQPPPKCRLRQFPVRDLHGFIWLFAGQRAESRSVAPMGLPEWEQLDQVCSVAAFEVGAHFSFLIDNLMDMHHGHLHAEHQVWSHAQLQDLHASPQSVSAMYRTNAYLRVRGFWDLLPVVFPSLRKARPEDLRVNYHYPHWRSTLGGDFTICCLICPVSATHTRAYLIHFTSLKAFRNLSDMPDPFRRWVRSRCFNSSRSLLEGLIVQDRMMIEEEQQAYAADPSRRGVETNPTLQQVHRLIERQACHQEPSIA